MSQIAPGMALPTSAYSQFPSSSSPLGAPVSPYGVSAATLGGTPSPLQTPSTLNSAIGGSPGLDTSSLTSMISQIMSMMMSLITQLVGGLGGGQQTPGSADASGTPTPSPAPAPADSSVPQDSGGGGGGCHGGGNAGNAGNSGGAGNAGSADPGNSTPSPTPTPAPSPSGTPAGSPSGAGDPGASAEQQQFLQLINNERAKNGLNPVKLNDKLDQTAVDYAGAMSSAGQMTHTLNGTQFGDRMKQHGYNWSNATENIAEGQQSVQDVFNAWMSDQGHRDNLLSPGVTEIGLGHVNGYWDQEGAAPG